MRSKPKDSKHPKIFQSPAAASVTAAYALAKSENLDFTVMEKPNLKADLSVEVGALKEEKRALESSIVGIKQFLNTIIILILTECLQESPLNYTANTNRSFKYIN